MHIYKTQKVEFLNTQAIIGSTYESQSLLLNRPKVVQRLPRSYDGHNLFERLESDIKWDLKNITLITSLAEEYMDNRAWAVLHRLCARHLWQRNSNRCELHVVHKPIIVCRGIQDIPSRCAPLCSRLTRSRLTQ
jgi:hypothetical protein